MSRKDRLIIELLKEVDRLEETIKTYKEDYSLYIKQKEKEISELKLANERIKNKSIELGRPIT